MPPRTPETCRVRGLSLDHNRPKGEGDDHKGFGKGNVTIAHKMSWC